MSEQVKVFKNINSHVVTTAAVAADTEYVLLTTTASQQAVIKDVNLVGLNAATLEMDGYVIATSSVSAPNIVASGNLIMGPNSTLKIKMSPITASFKGMFFSNGTEAVTRMVGTGIQATTGTDTALTSVEQVNTNSVNITEAVAVNIGGVTTFYRMHAGTVYYYTDSSTSHNGDGTFSLGDSASHGLATDGVKYLYSIKNNGSHTLINRYNLLTGIESTINTTSAMFGRVDNQGSFLAYHDNHLYSKVSASNDDLYIINLTTLDVVNRTGMGLSGSYSDGGGIVTNLAGDSYLVEQATSQWGYYKIGTDTTFNTIDASSSASTEYGNGFMEVAPGIAYIYSEYSDTLIIIDTNTTPPSRVVTTNALAQSTRNAAISSNFGNRFAAAGHLIRAVNSTTINAYVSGILLTDGV